MQENPNYIYDQQYSQNQEAQNIDFKQDIESQYVHTFIYSNNFKLIKDNNRSQTEQIQLQQNLEGSYNSEQGNRCYIQDQQSFAQIFLNSEIDFINSSEDKKLEQTEQFQQNSQYSLNNSTSKDSGQPQKGKKQQKKKIKNGKLNSVNITKNYIMAILLYIERSQDSIMNWMEWKGIKMNNPHRFFAYTLRDYKKKYYSISHLKNLIQKNNIYGKVIRVFGYKFLREETIQYMYYLRKKDRDNMIKFRNIILSAFTEPDYFDKLIY